MRIVATTPGKMYSVHQSVQESRNDGKSPNVIAKRCRMNAFRKVLHAEAIPQAKH